MCCMEKELVINTIKEVAVELNYNVEDHEDNFLSLSKDDNYKLVVGVEPLDVPILSFSTNVCEIEQEKFTPNTIKLMNKINCEIDSKLLLPMMPGEDSSVKRLFMRRDILALSKEHLQNYIPIIIDQLFKERDYCVEMLGN